MEQTTPVSMEQSSSTSVAVAVSEQPTILDESPVVPEPAPVKQQTPAEKYAEYVLDGRVFNKLFPEKHYKLISQTRHPTSAWNRSWIGSWFYVEPPVEFKSYEFVYSDGLNVDTVPFNPTGYCSAGGLYFTNIENFFCHCHTYHTHVVEVIVPDDAKVYIEHRKYKADKLILKLQDRRTITKFICEEYQRLTICGGSSDFIINTFKLIPTDKLTEDMVKYFVNFIKCGKFSLNFVPEHLKTAEICELAVENADWSIQFVPAHLLTLEMCNKVILNNPHLIAYIPEHFRAHLTSIKQLTEEEIREILEST